MDLSKGRLSGKSEKIDCIKVVAEWKPTKEVSPAWNRLWQLLLSPKGEPKEKEGVEK